LYILSLYRLRLLDCNNLTTLTLKNHMRQKNFLLLCPLPASISIDIILTLHYYWFNTAQISEV